MTPSGHGKNYDGNQDFDNVLGQEQTQLKTEPLNDFDNLPSRSLKVTSRLSRFFMNVVPAIIRGGRPLSVLVPAHGKTFRCRGCRWKTAANNHSVRFDAILIGGAPRNA